MYGLYKKTFEGPGTRYIFKEQISLFGCNEGYIPYLLLKTVDSTASEPLPWHVNIEKAMALVDQPGDTLIINLKPNSTEPNLSLYELVDVWGYSSSGWTPVMLYLKGLFIDANPAAFEERNFVRLPEEVDDPIFSMMYLLGTIKSGVIQGRWTPPGPSSTNSVLLWPDTFEYFAEKAREIMGRHVPSGSART
jgi:hypothetical protein